MRSKQTPTTTLYQYVVKLDTETENKTFKIEVEQRPDRFQLKELIAKFYDVDPAQILSINELT